VVLIALILAANLPVWQLLLVVTFGIVLGPTFNWGIGHFLIGVSNRRWFPLSRAELDKASGSYMRWGHWSLLASWVQGIVDPLTLVARVLGEPFWRFVLIIKLAKRGPLGRTGLGYDSGGLKLERASQLTRPGEAQTMAGLRLEAVQNRPKRR
jgi:hypothetical protein